MLYHFADCTLDTALHTLHRAGQDLRLSRKVFEVLCYLLAHRDQVVSKQELCDRIWEGVAISDATLESCIRAVRASLGDTGQEQRIIQTQRGYGYQCVVVVREEHASSPELLPVPPTLPVTSPPLTEPVRDSAAPALPGVYLCFTCQHANRHDATFCAACGARLRQTCSACGQSSPIPAAFCTACGHPFVAPVLSGTFQPDSTLGSSGERKPITVLCCAVSLMTGTGERVDMDTRHSVMQKLQDLSQDVIRRYGGRLHSVIDECFLIMFGVPVTQEDDARRAVRVAFELRQRLHTQQEHSSLPDGATLTLRIGVHTGPVVVGGRRDDTAVATVVGDVMACAMALQEQAPPGSILCSDATMHLIEGAVHFGEGRAQRVPGHPLPVIAYPVLAENTWRPPGRLHGGRTLSPFVGRRREMATLHDLLAQAEAGRGQVVGIVGEAGIGKSRLLYEFRQSLKDHWVTYRSCRCLSYGNTTPYLPVLELLRDNCGIAETDLPEEIRTKVEKSLQDVQMEPETWAPVLFHLLGMQEGAQLLAPLSPEARKARTMTALTQLCLHGSRQRPLILEVEDLHWVDASSEELLNALIERIAGVPILLLATYRPGYRPAWLDKSYATQVSLHPLAPQESLQVVQTILPTATLPTPLVPQLLAKADGNPFFLEELARTVVEQGGDVPATTVPDTVQAVLTARLDRLPASAKSLLQAAAVIGREIDFSLLQAIAEVPEGVMQQDLQRLQAAEFLYEASMQMAPLYIFKHALTQEVTYQSILRPTRQQYHMRIAQVLETQSPEVVETRPELLAHHYTRADQGERAIPYWYCAGQRAVERSANVEAISHLTRGLDLLQTLPVTPARIKQKLDLHLAFGAPLLMLKGQTAPEVEETYNRALGLCQQLGEGERTQHFSALVGLWRYYITCGRFPQARECGEQCLSLAQSGHDPALLQEAHIMLGSISLYMGELIAAREHLERGATLYDLQRLGALTLSRGTHLGVLCLSRLSWVLWILGYPESALTKVQGALRLAQESSHTYSIVFARYFAAMIHQCRREARAVQEHAEAVLALSKEQSFVMWSAQGLFMHGWALAQQAHVDEGIEQMRQSLAMLEAMGVEVGNSSLLMMLTEIYRTAGQTAAGDGALAEAKTIMDKNAEGYYAAERSRLAGELLLQGSQGQQVVDAEWHFQQALTLAHRQHAKSFELRAAMSLSRLWQGHGKRTAARHLLAEIYSWFTEGHDTIDLQEAKALLETLQ